MDTIVSDTRITAAQRDQLIATIEPHLAAERGEIRRIEAGEGTCPNWDLNGTWEMKEFAEARRLTWEWDMEWYWDGWASVLDSLRSGKFAGVQVVG